MSSQFFAFCASINPENFPSSERFVTVSSTFELFFIVNSASASCIVFAFSAIPILSGCNNAILSSTRISISNLLYSGFSAIKNNFSPGCCDGSLNSAFPLEFVVAVLSTLCALSSIFTSAFSISRPVSLSSTVAMILFSIPLGKNSGTIVTESSFVADIPIAIVFSKTILSAERSWNFICEFAVFCVEKARFPFMEVPGNKSPAFVQSILPPAAVPETLVFCALFIV